MSLVPRLRNPDPPWLLCCPVLQRPFLPIPGRLFNPVLIANYLGNTCVLPLSYIGFSEYSSVVPLLQVMGAITMLDFSKAGKKRYAHLLSCPSFKWDCDSLPFCSSRLSWWYPAPLFSSIFRIFSFCVLVICTLPSFIWILRWGFLVSRSMTRVLIPMEVSTAKQFFDYLSTCMLSPHFLQ